ncbi:MAG: hypothetical protein ACI9VN_001588, partial [Patescibacteria group bacterium]
HTNKLITSPAVADNGEPVVNNAPKIKTEKKEIDKKEIDKKDEGKKDEGKKDE